MAFQSWAASALLAIAAGGAAPIDVAAFAAFNSAFGQFTSAFCLSPSLNMSIEAAPLFARIRPVFEAPLEVEPNAWIPASLGACRCP